MSTFLFDKIIFGPVKSRRLGISLGINVMQPSSKHCNFDCIYCECGWNGDSPKGTFNSINAITTRLEAKLAEMQQEGQLPDVITFAGNGEPTMHPEFESLIDRTIEIRNRMAPQCKIAVLSNATMIDRESVRHALSKIDNNILKLDSVNDQTVRVINQPNNARKQSQTIDYMKMFDGKVIIQTMFLRGTHNGTQIDNTTQDEIDGLLEAARQIKPQQIMFYSIDRDTPAQGLTRVSKEEMQIIADRFEKEGFTVAIA